MPVVWNATDDSTADMIQAIKCPYNKNHDEKILDF